MRFVNPQFLWALLLVILPILIHLFNFRKHKQLYFSSLQFVKAVDTSDRKRRNLLHILILLSRVFAIIFIVFAFAQPYFLKNEQDLSNESVYVIYVDNSASMTLNGVSSNLLNETRENTRKLVQQLPADAKILLNSNHLSAEEGQVSSREEILSRLDFLNITSVQHKKEEIIQWQKMQVKLEHPSARIHHYIISDFQKFDSDFTELPSDSVHLYHPIVMVPQSTKNITIDTVYFDSPIHQTGATTNLNYGVRNYSNEALKGLELSIEIGNIKRKLTINVPANGRAEDKLSYVDFAPGLIKGSITVEDEPFTLDNTLHFAYAIEKEIKICVLSDNGSYNQIPNLYVLDKHYKVTATSINSINKEIITNHDLVILNGIIDITSGVLDDLKSYTNAGGSILIIPAEKTAVSSTNKLLAALELPQLVDLQKNAQKITKIQQKETFFTGVFNGNAEVISLPGVTNYFTLNEQQSLSLPLVNLQNGIGLLYKHKTKPYFLLNNAIESGQSSLTKDALFPTILLRIAEQANQSPYLYTSLGEDGYITLRKNFDANKPIYLVKDETRFIPQKIEINGSFHLNISDEEAIKQLTPGIYAIEQDQQILDHIAINLDRKESNTSFHSLKEVEQILKEKGIKNIQGISIQQDSDNVHIPMNREIEWWKYCIIISLLFILCEIFLLIYGKHLRRKDK